MSHNCFSAASPPAFTRSDNRIDTILADIARRWNLKIRETATESRNFPSVRPKMADRDAPSHRRGPRARDTMGSVVPVLEMVGTAGLRRSGSLDLAYFFCMCTYIAIYTGWMRRSGVYLVSIRG